MLSDKTIADLKSVAAGNENQAPAIPQSPNDVLFARALLELSTGAANQFNNVGWAIKQIKTLARYTEAHIDPGP